MKKTLPGILILLSIVGAIFSLTIGSVNIPLGDILNIKDALPSVKTIILKVRAPRIVMSILIGMMLSSSGVVVQGVFQNPLADPYIIGIAASATFGAVVAFLLGLPDIMYGILAFVCCIGSTLVIFKLANKKGRIDVTTLLIIGIAVSSFIGALTSFAMYLIGEDSFKITMWLMGYLGGATWKQVILIIPPLLLSLVYFYFQRNQLDALLSGDEEAYSLGINVEKLKIRLLIVSSLIVAFSVAFSGMIGFVGLIIPHTIRMLTGPSTSRLLPNATLGGGLFLLVCDTLGRSVLSPTEIPIGVVTAFFGAPFFLYLAFKSKKGVV